MLNLVDAAKPECDDLAKRGVELGQSLSRMASQEDLNIDRARALMGVCGKFAERTAAFADKQANVLSDIMMAQALEGTAQVRGDTEVVLHAQCSAEDFYTRNGYVVQGAVFEEAGIRHIAMQKRLLASETHRS